MLKKGFPSSLFNFGLLMIVISSLLVIFNTAPPGGFFSDNQSPYLSVFGITMVYGILSVIFKYVKSWKGPSDMRFAHFNLFLILFMLSCFQLNQAVQLMSKPHVWVIVTLVLASLSLIALSMPVKWPVWLKFISMSILGISTLLFLYYGLLLVPLYGYGLIFFWFFGLSLHLFIPLGLVITSIIHYVRLKRENGWYGYAFVFFLIIGLAYGFGFGLKWNHTQDELRQTANEIQLNQESDLPEWLAISERIKQDHFTQKVLTSKYFYDLPDHQFFIDFGSNRFNDDVVHDPLIYTASALTQAAPISDDFVEQIIRSKKELNAQFLDRYWSGEGISISNQITNVKLYEKDRLAYLEKTIEIKNTSSSSRPKEAMFNFYLPDGAVPSSLSLWINGEEREGLITSKQKADKAYKQIVGVESRDPALLKWEEGNRVSLRVFPCTPQEVRRVKVGFTIPLHYQYGKVTLESVEFEGPALGSQKETIMITSSGLDVKKMESDLPFNQKDNHILFYDGSTKPWKLIFEDDFEAGEKVNFKGNSYHTFDAQVKEEKKVERVILDLNSSWTQEEYDQVSAAVVGQYPVYVYTDRLETLDEKHIPSMFQKFEHKSMSLLPYYKFKDVSNTLFISKTNNNIPDFKSLEGSAYSDEMIKLNQRIEEPLYMFTFGEEDHSLIQTLEQFGMATRNHYKFSDLVNELQAKRFQQSPHRKNGFYINQSSLFIEKQEQDSSKRVSVNTHLLRLFAYEQTLKSMGSRYFAEEEDEAFIQSALMANVVTPVTSLVVLETQHDYDRFDIEEVDGLGNASVNNSGSVPEPHEWMLMIIGGLFVIGVMLKSRLN